MDSSDSSSSTKQNVIAAVGTWPFSQRSVNYIVAECFKATMAFKAKGVVVSQSPFTSCSDDPDSPNTLVVGGGGGVGEHLVKAIEMVEADKEVHTVGIHSYPNADGVLQLDAAFINATTGAFGSVLGITGFHGAIRGAYLLALKGPHTVLAGEGAERFMMSHGMERKTPEEPPVYDGTELGKETVASHDTVGIVAVCGDEIVVGCSTSGMRGKAVGRIGDSAIYGSGCYAQVGVGGAAGTGDGDLIVRFPFSFIAVEAMRMGMTPQEAAEHAIDRLTQCPGYDAAKSEAAIVVMNAGGEYGTATTPSWEGVFAPSFADVDMLKAAAQAQTQALSQTATAANSELGGPESEGTAAGGGACVIC